MATVQLAVVASVLAGGPPSAPTALSLEVVGSVLALGALGTGIAFLLHSRNIRIVGASMASMVTYLIPIFAIVVGVVVLGEHLTWYQPVGAPIVLAGVVVSQGLFGRTAAPPPKPAPVAAHRS